MAALADEAAPWLAAPRGTVVSVKARTVYISRESLFPLKPGVPLTVIRELEPLIHPVTGEKLGAVTSPVAQASVESDDGKLITATVVSSRAPIKPGDRLDSAPRKVALLISSGTPAVGSAQLEETVTRRVGGWEGVSLAAPGALARFMYDEGGADILRAETLQRMGARLGAGFLLHYRAREESGVFLGDIEIYSLATGERIAAFANMINKGQTPAVTPPPPAPAAPAPALAPVAQGAPPPSPAPAAPPAGKLVIAGKTLAVLDSRITALLAHDMDGDGAREIVAGLDSRLAVFRREGDQLREIWSRDASSLYTIVGLAAGDFDGDGRTELYVNRLADGAARSQRWKADGKGGFALVEDKVRGFYYTGPGGLYWRGQTTILALEDRLYHLTWSGGKFEQAHYADLPKGARLSGLAFADLDGDGAADLMGFDRGKSLAWRSSKSGEWNRINGEFGGSNVAIRLDEAGEMTVYEEMQPPPAPLAFSAGSPPALLAPHNHHALGGFTSIPVYFKSQVHALIHEGMGFDIRASTPVSDGIIHAAAPYGEDAALVGRSETGLLSGAKGEILLLTVEGR
ncbi:MAG: VCBS repeat-containing protein [Nitrospinae bacterium]|nr:VCBS repeat-containing protein [Nitrospinota bacterium]